MKNIFYKRTIILLSLLVLFATKTAFGSALFLETPKEILSIGEQSYVDLMLDPEGVSVNTIAGTIFLPENVSLVRVEDGKSMVNLWVDKPKLSGRQLNFSGLMTGGFSGVINPFNPNKKMPGLILRLIFEPNNSGKVKFSTSDFYLNLNDGVGTELNIPSTSLSFNVSETVRTVKYLPEDDTSPELEAYITKDSNIYDGKYVLVFRAIDRGSGIKNVMIKEGRRKWKEIESPYLLKDQSRHSDIIVQANNFSGSGVSINISGEPYNWKLILIVVGSLFLLFGLYYLFRKYVFRK